MRVVPLAQMLPTATPVYDEQSRRSLFQAFKAASIVFAKIRADVKHFISKTPPEIHPTSRVLPGVTEIKSVGTSPSSPIKFTPLHRFDKIVYRNLYHAQVTSTNEEIYVKFTQKYLHGLHMFCAKRWLAPELLGFERLPGGWFAVAMKKIDTVPIGEIGSFIKRNLSTGNYKPGRGLP